MNDFITLATSGAHIPLLPIVWFAIIGIELALYILLDGGNLGIGILSLLPQKEDNRSLMLHVVGPIWDANETWLLVAAGSLFGAFPAVYAIGLNALFVPAIVIAVGIILRAGSFAFFEFSEMKSLWTKVFGVGSLLVAIGHGLLFGGLLSGIKIVDGHFGGGAFDFLTPFTLLFTIGLFFAYVVLGYSALIGKIDYALQVETFPRILGASVVTFLALLTATFVLPNMSYIFMTAWTAAPTSYLLYLIAGAIFMTSVILGYNAIAKKNPEQMHFFAMLIFVLGYAGMVVGLFPYIVPPAVTIFDVASPDSTLKFMLYGIGPILPIVFAYNWYLHKVFGSNFAHNKEGEGY
ncbi:MAG: cytochrome d ubiquinol oxidase subunit II [Candidatus Paceibacterota bacterium]|jgi:cytochrome d ubiquinol oxidase subunit II